MNNTNKHEPETDPEVSAAYRAIANESAPTQLDAIVLQKAAAEARSVNGLASYIYSIRRPLTLAVTMLLALSMTLQFNDVFMGTTPDEMNGVAERGTGAGDMSAAMDASSRHILEQKKQGEDIMSQGLLNNPMPSTIGGSEAMRPEIARYCDSAQTLSAELWWHCIEELDHSGRNAEAASERELLINTYPDFKLPE